MVDVPSCTRGVRSFRLLFAVAAWLVPLALHAQSLTIVSGNSQSLVPNEPSQPLVVQARDSTGAPLAGAARVGQALGAHVGAAVANVPSAWHTEAAVPAIM